MSTVRDVLEKKGRAVWAVAPATPVFDAIREMAERGVGALLVMDGTQLIGIVSERDYARRVILQGKSSKTTLVQEIMTSDPVRVGLDSSLDACMQLMTARRVRHLPIVEAARVHGVVSIGDVVKFIMTDQKRAIAELERYVSG